MKVVKRALLFISMLLVSAQSFTFAQENVSIGQTVRVQSKVLNEERTIQIALPIGYNNTKDSYPVLYLLDGENNFHYTAGLTRYMSFTGTPQMIVVGIPNTQRNRDFTPRKNEAVEGSGGADNFLKFLHDELFPYMEKNYRVQPYRILAGHSLCGMFSIYTMLKNPDYFSAYIAISPWVISDNNYILDYSDSRLSQITSLNKKLYMTAGSLEPSDFLNTLDKYINIMKVKAPKDLEWTYKFMEGEDHASIAPLTVYNGLRYIYKDWQLPEAAANKGLEGILGHYRTLSEKFGYVIQAPEFVLNIAGYNFLRGRNYNEAIAIFKKNTEMYPDSPNTFDSLGEAYENAGQLDLAKENYEKAYKLGSAANDQNTRVYKANLDRMQAASGK